MKTYHLYCVLLSVLLTGKLGCMEKRSLTDKEKSLLQDIEQFNAQVGTKGWNLESVAVDQREIEGIRLNQPQIRNTDWQNVIIRDGDVRGGVFEGTYFAGVQISQTRFVNTHFVDCTFQNAVMRNVTFEDVTFENCKFKNNRFENITFTNTRFIDLQEYNSTFKKSHVNSVRLEKSSLKKTGFYDGNMSSIRISMSNLEGVSFSGIQSQDMEFSNSTVNYVSFDEGTHQYVDFHDCQGEEGIVFTSIQIEELKFERCNEMRRVVLYDTECENFILRGSHKINDFGFIESTVQRLEITDSELSIFDIEKSSIQGPSTIQDAVLDGLNFRGSEISGLTMEQCEIKQYLVLTEAQFENLSLRNITYGSDLEKGAEGVTYIRSDSFGVR